MNYNEPKKQKLTKKQSEIIGATMIEALNAEMSFQEIAEILEQKYGVIINTKAFQKGINDTVEKYEQ